MSIKNKFVQNNIKKPEVGNFLFTQFGKYGYSHSEIKKTHTGIDVTIYANKPGLIIGRGGENINKVSDLMKSKFGFDNIRIDVQEIEKPYLNSKIVAEEIKSALERGVNHRRIGSIMMRKVMESGAIGTEIRLSGKLGSAKARVQRFYDGYLKYSGETAKKYVDYTSLTAVTKAGAIGIKVRIMKEYPEAKIRELKEIPMENEEKELKCPYCGKVYDKERSLKIHIGQKHADQIGQGTEEDKPKKKEEVKNSDKKDTKKAKEVKENTDKPEEKKETKEKGENNGNNEAQ